MIHNVLMLFTIWWFDVAAGIQIAAAIWCSYQNLKEKKELMK